MNVYIYEGLSRNEAKRPVVYGNAQPNVGSVYKVPYQEGMMIVAYPDKNKETQFEFDFWAT